jgi:hypothetical protein
MEIAKAEAGELANDVDDVLSYLMFPGPGKEFLEWRRDGLGPEREMVAAIVGAMTIGERKASRAEAAEPMAFAPGNNGAPAAWRNFGRMRQMR